MWHIRAGVLQLTDGQVITSDPFSIARVGTPWRTQSWLLELFYGQLDAMTDSLVWANLFVFVIGSMTAGLVGIAVYRSAPSPVPVALVVAVMVWLAGPFLQARPVIVSFLLLAMLVVVIQHHTALLWLVLPIIWLWSGIHGSWVIGGVLVVLELLRTRDVRLLKVGSLALISTVVTAHGFGTWQILVDFAEARGALGQIQEWLPPDFGDVVQAPYLLLFVGVIAASMSGKIRGRDLVVILPFLFLGMTSRRFVLPSAIVLSPWAASGIPALSVPRSAVSQRVVGVLMAVAALGVVAPLMFGQLGVLDTSRFPDADLQVEMRGRNVFYDDGVGGFMIYSDWPERLVAIDDRGELYGEEYFEQFTRARSGEYEELFSEFDFDAALTRSSWTLTDRLTRDGWEKRIERNGLILFIRPQDQ